MGYPTAPYLATLNDPYPQLQGHTIIRPQKWYEIQTQFQQNTNKDLHTPYSTVSFRMILTDLAKYDKKRRAVSLRQLSFLCKWTENRRRWRRRRQWCNLFRRRTAISLHIGPRHNATCNISTSFGIAILWVDNVKYLGVFIVHSHTFRCDLDHAKNRSTALLVIFLDKLVVQQMRKWWYSY